MWIQLSAPPALDPEGWDIYRHLLALITAQGRGMSNAGLGSSGV